jgi:hypothetical protein
MNLSPREYRLFHYTKQLTTLVQILEGGFWPRYCPEDFSWLKGGSPLYILVPLASFCDIPVFLSNDHREAYGNYAIGLSKEWGVEKGLTPVLYINDEGPIAHQLMKFLRTAVYGFIFEKREFGQFWRLLPYFKPVTGYFPDGQVGTRDYPGIKKFDEEMEWRFVPVSHADSIYPEPFFKEAAQKRRDDMSKSTFNSKLTFEPNDVEVILVESASDLDKIAYRFPDYSSKIFLWSQV